MAVSQDGVTRRDRWVPPARPDWVARANAEGEHFDLRAVVPLNADSLISTARATTELDDFGDDSWYEPFRRLVTELDEEAPLNLFGRLQTRQDLLLALEGRLRVEATYASHPEIEHEQIVEPLFIIGQGRSGTSALLNMLSAHPDNRSVKHWEAMMPCPPPEAATSETDPRIERAEALTSIWNRVTPELQAVHEFHARVPTENDHVHYLSFNSPAWFNAFLGQTPKYMHYCMTETDRAEAYRYEKRVLKLLQWRNPRKRWIFKSPFTLNHLSEAMSVYPDAGFIWPHRDPVKALASVVSLVGILHWMRSDHPFQGDSLAQFTNSDLAAKVISQPIQWLEDGRVPRERLCNLQYVEFVRDPMKAVEQIYEFFDIPLSDEAKQAMSRYMDENPRSSRPVHEYDEGSAQEIELEREAFRAYQEYFGVIPEIR